ncbi:hypothetical protein VMCG_04904 [Cytospora schulzeri]|uniref:Uncharacterized protein n=1 Tax=Cytospora schulzeri TaxID=448051 RepID=A0A423WN85_9PEZI|nr:hypothetical protein VMCG_04904 [Valsa malicola]
MAHYNFRNQRGLQRAAMPSMVGEGTYASPISLIDDDNYGVASGVAYRVPNQDTVTPAPPLFPNAHFDIHRIGYSTDADFRLVGRDLEVMLALIDPEAIFRVTMTQCDTPTGSEGPLVWSWKHASRNSLTAEEYGNILKLGQPSLGKLVLFTYCTRQNHSWGLVRQVLGRHYSLEDCLNILRIPQELRNEIDNFGPRLWTVGQKMPRLYICKDMPLAAVVTKMDNLMRLQPTE